MNGNHLKNHHLLGGDEQHLKGQIYI